ncbi:MAG: NUDIX domain-containing protein [Caldilineaceae bacterium]|nr:NUDIX domain-containing protein [Caldilineaceae bacterium]
MIIYPAIRLQNGAFSRLHEENSAIATSTDPIHLAKHWATQGAEWLHIVNLDGALEAASIDWKALQRPSNLLIQRPGQKKPTSPHQTALQSLSANLRCLHEIKQAVNVPIQFSGGLRTLDDIELAFTLGANRVVLGTAAVENPELVRSALLRWGPQKLVVRFDAHNGQITSAGWQKKHAVSAIELGHHMRCLGIERVIYTDIARNDIAHNGPLSGVNLAETTRLGDLTDLHVIASGGVKDINDIKQLKSREHYNIEGVIVGESLYAGTLALPQAIEIGHRPLAQHSAGFIPYRIGNNGPEFLLLFNLFSDQWQFPRGGVEPGECNLDCAQREFTKETGLPVEQIHKDCRIVLEYTTSIRGHEIERTILYYLAEIGPGPVEMGNENHCEARWLSPYETWELLTETSPEQLPALDAALSYLNISLA